MKKKNLNFLLALLAALALVFAGACSDGSDDSDDTGSPQNSTDNPETTETDTGVLSSLIAGTTWTYSNDSTSGDSYVSSVTIEFSSEDSTVTLTASGKNGTNEVTSGSPIASISDGDTGTLYSSVTYTVSGNTVTITSSTASATDKSELDESAVIVLALDNDSIEAGELSTTDGSVSTLTVQSVAASTTGGTAALTVKDSSDYLLDILSSTYASSGQVKQGVEFEYTPDDEE